MTHEVLSVYCGGPGAFTPGHSVESFENTDNRLSPCQAYQYLLENSESEFLIYVHDDVTVYDPDWCKRVLYPFERDRVAVVGLGGATSLGHPDLYRRPYRIQDLARGDYVSNQTDWQTHGGHETGVKRVAVVDAFFMAVRRDFLLSVGGWPVKHLTHHCLDLWLACEAVRHGKETWMAGVNCTHHGGGTSVKPIYKEAKWLQGGSLEEDHARPHRWLYDEYRDVLPIRVDK